jgi:hypothetical protein
MRSRAAEEYGGHPACVWVPPNIRASPNFRATAQAGAACAAGFSEPWRPTGNPEEHEPSIQRSIESEPPPSKRGPFLVDRRRSTTQSRSRASPCLCGSVSQSVREFGGIWCPARSPRDKTDNVPATFRSLPTIHPANTAQYEFAIDTPHSALRTPHSTLRIPHFAFPTPHSPLPTPHSALQRSETREAECANRGRLGR